ncbi:MAG: ABC transporter permease [Phycisphaeraceae bacterium]|nr:ABC transporter permease [Phycisphaeraceae bacterium]
MYKLLLISKYLRRKLAPLFAALAVTICTAMVIIVASVMGGFLDLMQTTAKQLTPDVVIKSSLTGFGDYEKLIDQLEALPEVALATPAIEYPATVTIGGFTDPVQVIGMSPSRYNQIVPYSETLMWSADDLFDEEPIEMTEATRRGLRKGYDLKEAGRTLTTPSGYERYGMAAGGPAAVVGIAANRYQSRLSDGSYAFHRSIANVPLTVPNKLNPIKLALPVFAPNGEPIDAVQLRIPAVNEFKTGYYEIDKAVIFVPFDWLQKSLKMQRFEEYTDFDELTGEGGEAVIQPARCTDVYVKAAEGVDALTLKAAVQPVVDAHQTDRYIGVMTWEDVHGTLLGAVKNEKGMVTFLFVIISIVAIIMVATTFYMIVLEKTRDIGVLRAIGAPATGVLTLFMTYGLAIGLIGAGLGVWLAWFTVTNLNNLQEALATKLATLIATVVLAGLVALLSAIAMAYINRRRDFTIGAGVLVFLGTFGGLMAITFYAFPVIQLPGFAGETGLDSKIGWRMWDPQLYFFEKIPDQVNWGEVFLIWVGAVVSCVLGAIIPAVIASRLNPVEALRYE